MLTLQLIVGQTDLQVLLGRRGSRLVWDYRGLSRALEFAAVPCGPEVHVGILYII